MGRVLSRDLRGRVVAAVEDGLVSGGGGTFQGERSERDPLAAAVASARHTGGQAPGWRSPIGQDRGPRRPRPRRYRTSVRHHAGGVGHDAARAWGEHQQCDPLAVLRPSPDHAQKKARASEQDRADIVERRWAWFEGQLDLDPERLVFIDET